VALGYDGFNESEKTVLTFEAHLEPGTLAVAIRLREVSYEIARGVTATR